MSVTRHAGIVAIVAFLTSGLAIAEPSLTIYNQNFAVVRQPLTLDLGEGISQASVTDITMHVEPDSVILRDPTGQRALQILEQNYRAEPVSQGLLLSLYEGKEIGFLVRDPDGKGERTVYGKIIRSGYVPHSSGMQRYGQQYAQAQASYAYSSSGTGQPIIEVNKKLRFSLPGEPLFPSLTDDSILKPTLTWVLQSDQAGRIDAELSYVTGGMSWEADYSMLSPTDGNTVDVIGWITMDNQTGKTFENARIKLMAGDVSKIQPNNTMLRYDMDSVAAPTAGGAPPVSEKAFEEYHLYTLNRPATLHDRETKQVEFLRAEGATAQRYYVYDGLKIDFYRGYSMENIRREPDFGTQSNPKVQVMKEIRNSKENHLGVPLPKGRVRFYRRDSDDQLEFTGENVIDHTPRDETIRAFTGDAFDLVGERKRTEFKLDEPRGMWADESFQITLHNHKEKDAVEIRVVEHLYRWTNWKIVEKSDPYVRKDSQTVEFRVQVPAGGEKILTYKVHYSW